MYRQSRFKQASILAVVTLVTGCGATKQADPGRAAYLAGLSAYQLGDNEEARRRLTAAVGQLEGEDAAKARAALGLVELSQHRPEEAADAFAVAWPVLHGEDARQAARFAAAAYHLVGDDQSAADWDRIAHEHAEGPPPPGSFTIQVGAFQERDRAERAAVDAAEVAENMGLAPVRIVTRDDRHGSVLYVVQIGSFGTRTEAASARRRVGKLQYIVAAQQPG